MDPDTLKAAGKLSAQQMSAASQYWSTNAELLVEYEGTRTKFQKAMSQIVYTVSDASPEENSKMENGAGGEPVLHLLKLVDESVYRR